MNGKIDVSGLEIILNYFKGKFNLEPHPGKSYELSSHHCGDFFLSVFHNWGQNVTSLSVRMVEGEPLLERILKRIPVFLLSYIYFGSAQKRSFYSVSYISCAEYKKVKKSTSHNFNQ